MDYFADCPDDVLIEIFENLDLKTRLLASRTCKKWNRLIKDPSACMENVTKCQIEGSDIEIVTSVLNHIGKTKRLAMVEPNLAIISRISEMINDGRMKIDTFNLFSSKDDSIDEYVNALLPSSISKLNLLSKDVLQILTIDWSKFVRLENLSLFNILIDWSASSLPSLKRLDISLFVQGEGVGAVIWKEYALITTMTNLPNLEKLRLNYLNFNNPLLKKFLSAMKNKLPDLRRLCFNWMGFLLSDLDEDGIFDRLMENSNLKEIKFISCKWNWIDLARLFLRTCTRLDIMKIEAFISEERRNCYAMTFEEIREIYQLTKLIDPTKKSSLELKLHFDGNTDQGLNKFAINIELSQMLSQLFLTNVKSIQFLRRLFNCGSFEKLRTIDFKTSKMNDTILKAIAQFCPYLENLRLSDCQEITENGLKWFLIYWHERKSQRLSIECPVLDIEGLFGTSFEKGRGILDEPWWMGEEEGEANGEPASKRSKKTSGKRWMVIRKIFFEKKFGVRLIIRDQNDTIEGGDQKMLVIKDYHQEKFEKNWKI